LPSSFKLGEGEVVNNTLDLTRLPKEVLLILEILKEKDKRQKVKYLNSLSKEVDWQQFLEYAVHHRVYPMLYRQLKQIQETLSVPTFVIQSLEELYKANTFEMLKLSAEMNEIGKLFADQGINTLFLKGPVLAHALFGDISYRTSKDLDVLIPIDKLDKAEIILKDLGYQKEIREHIFNEWKWKYNDISFYHYEKQTQVELHYRLNNWPEIVPSFNELWSRRRISTLTQNPCYFLGEEDLFYYLVSHGAKHGWSRLRWLMDIQQFMKLPMDWQILYQLFKKYKNIHLGGQTLILVSQLNELNITEEMKPLLTKRSRKIANSALFFIERMEILHDTSLPKDSVKYFRKYYSSIKPISQRILINLGKLHPSTDDVQTLPLPTIFYFLYFPLRPILWLLRKYKRSYRVN
jgi:hypothetical protein